MADEAERASVAQREASSKKFGTQMSSKMQDSVDLSAGLAGSELIREAQSMANSASVLGGVGDEVQRVKDAISAYGAELRKAEPDAATLTELSNNLRTAMENLGAGAGEAGTAFASYQSVLTDSATQVSTAAMHIQELQIAFDDDNVTDTFINELQEAINKAKEAKLPVEELEKALNAVKADKSSNNIKQLGVALKQTSFDTKTTTKAIKELGIEKVGETSKDSADRLKGMGDALNADAEAAGLAARRQLEFENATNEANDKVSQLKDKLLGTGLAYQSLGSAITGTLRGMSSFAMGLQSLSSIKDTLENTDLSSWEKTLQIMMSLGMAIPMVTTGLKSLGDGYLFVTSASTKGLAGQLAYMLGLDMEKLKSEEVTVVKGKEILARGKSGDAAVVEAAKKKGATVVTELDTAATWGNIAAKLIQHWYILAIILAIGALIAIIYKSVEAYNADAEAAKEATAQAQSLTERYNELTEASNEFRESCKGYEDAVKSFKDLEKGAEGYEEALKKANDEAKKLIETYKLYDDYEVKDGLIVIDEDALKDKQREMDAEARKAEGQKYQADIYANNANLRSQATNTSRKTAYFGTGTYTYTEGGAYENYRQLSGDEAQAIGKVINDFKEANEGVTPSAEQVKQALEELGSESGLASDAMNNLDIIITDETIGKFGDLADSMTEAQKANEYYARQIMGIAVEEKYGDELREKATDANGNFDQQKYNQLL